MNLEQQAQQAIDEVVNAKPRDLTQQIELFIEGLEEEGRFEGVKPAKKVLFMYMAGTMTNNKAYTALNAIDYNC